MQCAARTLPLLLLIAMGTGCTIVQPTKFTGGGTMPSSGGAQKAVMTVNADTCADTPKGRFTYADRSAVDFESVGGVSIRAAIAKAGLCMGVPEDDPENPALWECNCPLSPALMADYTSANPAAPGSGKLYACFAPIRDDTKQGTDKHVVLVQEVRMVGGPFDGYINKGVMDGNIQQHLCRQ
jgi:hypothetical protein